MDPIAGRGYPEDGARAWGWTRAEVAAGDMQLIAALVDRQADRLTIYYGAADTVVCMAHGHLSEVIQFAQSR